jgi:uncharacterized membrane protein YphA (DoxX/SURF4 family)
MVVSPSTGEAMKSSAQVKGLPLLFTAARVLLGVVFIIAGTAKIADPSAFAATIANYGILSGMPALVVATILPWGELLCGVGLVVGLFVRGSALLTILFLSIFTIVALYAMMRGLDISCGCFTLDPLAERIGWKKILENLALLGVSIVVYRFPRTPLSIEQYFRNRLKSGPES